MKLKLIINGEADPRDLTLDFLNVTTSKVTINAVTEGSTQPTPDPEPEPTPEPTPEPEPPQTGCGPVPPNVRVRKTSPPGTHFKETISSNQTGAGIIHAFEFNSGTGSGRVVATRVTNGEGKIVVITKCPGDLDNPAPGRSKGYSTESTSVGYTTNQNASPMMTCVLEPNTIYYANVINASSYYGDEPKCGGTCGFYFQKS